MKLRHLVHTAGEVRHEDHVYQVGPDGTLLDPATKEPAEVPRAVARAITAALPGRVEPIQTERKGMSE